MRQFLLFSAAFVFIAPAVAQDNVIRIIDEDGSVQEVEVVAPRQPSPPVKAEEPKPVPQQVKRAPEPPPPTPQEPPAPPEIDVPELEPQMPQELKAIVEPVAPAPEPVAEPQQEEEEGSVEEVRTAPEEVAPEEELVDWNQDTRQLPEGYMILPPRKPAEIPYRHARPDYNAPVVASGPVSKEQAVAIALEKAPPASSVVALPREYDGRPVYLVKFRTADGPLNIMVDMATGDIITP